MKYIIQHFEGSNVVTVWDTRAAPGMQLAATYDLSRGRSGRAKMLHGVDSRGKRAALRRWIARLAAA